MHLCVCCVCVLSYKHCHCILYSNKLYILTKTALHCDQVLDAFLEQHSITPNHQMTFMERAAMRRECRRLVKYIRLSDFVVRDTLLSLGIESADKLLKFLDPAGKPEEMVRRSFSLSSQCVSIWAIDPIEIQLQQSNRMLLCVRCIRSTVLTPEV